MDGCKAKLGLGTRPVRLIVGVVSGLFCRRGRCQLMGLVACLLLSVVVGLAQGSGSAEALMKLAIAAQQKGDNATAIQLYGKILKMRPHSGPAEYNLGLIFSKEKRFPEAIKLFSRALEDDSSLTNAYLYRGVAYYNLGDFGLAISSLKTFSKAHPDDPYVHFYLAGCYSALGNFADSAREFLDQLKITPRRGELYYYLGHCYLAMALQEMKTLSGASDGKYYMSLLLASEVALQGNYSTAEADVTSALKSSPQLPEAYVALGNLLLRKGQLASAKAQFQEALKKNPKDCSAFEGLGDADLAAGNVADSLAWYTKAEKLLPGCVQQPPPENLGLSPQDFRSKLSSLKADAERNRRGSSLALEFARLEYNSANGIVDVESHASKVSQPGRFTVSPGDDECRAVARRAGVRFQAPINLFLANCNELHGDLEGATVALAAAVHEAPNSTYVSYWTLRILMRLSRQALDRLAALMPNSYWITLIRAEWRELSGDRKGADAEYKKAIQESDNDPHILVEYARFKCNEHEYDEAVPILLKALKLVPYDPSPNALLGYIYFSKNQFAAAAPYLERAVKANPADEQSRIHLAEALMKLKKVQEAVAVLESAPSDPDGRVHYVLASCYRQLGLKTKMERALAIFAERQKNGKNNN